MATVRVATFNCENLFARFKFESNVDPEKVTKNGFTIDQTKFTILKEDEKKLTAKAILSTQADVIALQEVENLEVLRRFDSQRLKSGKYVHTMLVDGPDPRHIDVAVLSRFPITHVRSYQHLRSGSSQIFSRDCLEVDIDVGSGKSLILFVNHFKSMLDKKKPKEGRKRTRARRLKQAETVRQIVEDRFGSASPGNAAWIICGDLNDYPQAGEGTTTALGSLLGWQEVENVIERLPVAAQFTHFFDKGIQGNRLRQLDYLLVSRSLAANSPALPFLVRKGLSTKATEVSDARFPGVTASMEASDHCPLVMDVQV